ncbi:MAG: hypothetical protein MUO76_21940 [Anaerolineaceae bacterium]|nr:hypothetical protein [Anaerolineaceae bacterium]
MISYQHRNRRTVNLLKSIYSDHPEWTPCEVSLMPATWMKYRDELEELVLAHARIFPGYKRGSRDFDAIDNRMYELGRHTDCWGSVWENIERGLTGIPVTHPLEDWSSFSAYVPPDPLKDDLFDPHDWDKVRWSLEDAKKRGDLAVGKPLPHGFMYMRLTSLRGFENSMIDLAMDEPRLLDLIAVIEAYNNAVVQQYLQLGMEYPNFGEDLGMQSSLIMRPATWRKYIKPAYARMFKPCLDAEIPIFFHSDGCILDIIPDLIEIGVKVLNPQFRANGLEGLKDAARGKVALYLDLDRQLFPFASPAEIEDHIGEAYEALYLPEGGLMLYAECEPDVPLETIEAICSALEKICRLPEL